MRPWYGRHRSASDSLHSILLDSVVSLKQVMSTRKMPTRESDVQCSRCCPVQPRDESAARAHRPASRLQLRRLPPLLCRAFRVHVSSHQHHSTTTTLPTALPPSTPFLKLPLSCARQFLDRATTDLTTDHCHCHLTAASLNRQLTAASLLPHSKSSASLSDRIRLAR